MKKIPRPPLPTDPVAPGQRRRWCSWIADPWAYRCPRFTRTGEPCWCRARDAQVDGLWFWPWRVVPPIAPADEPGWSYDDEVGPVLLPGPRPKDWP
jgi:hypothetical protein